MWFVGDRRHSMKKRLIRGNLTPFQSVCGQRRQVANLSAASWFCFSSAARSEGRCCCCSGQTRVFLLHDALLTKFPCIAEKDDNVEALSGQHYPLRAE